MIHFDTTFNVNKQRYPVMVIGMPDRCGYFFPVAYFCISQRRGCDVAWCLRMLDRVLHETFQVQLAPEFVMMDGDKAQFNACQQILPESVVLMCWYHVTNNVLTKAKSKGADRAQTKKCFADHYDLHFAPTGEYETHKAEVIRKWDRLRVNAGAHRLARHVIKNWINHGMFRKWQAYHTPSGSPATNNPLEQYHKTLKINCNNARATVVEMLKSLDMARLTFLARHQVFSNITEVPARLRKLYKLLVAHNSLSASRLPGALQPSLFNVVQRRLPLLADDEKERLNRSSQ